MGITVSINHPAFPEGTEFGIDHLGVVPNGSSLEVPEENEQVFVNVKRESVADAFKSSPIVDVSGSSDVEVPQDEEQEQAPEGETTQQGQEAPQTTEEPTEGQVS